jgi:hypothetical protein
MGNCASLALYQPLLGDSDPWNAALNTVELAFNAAFSLEMVLRCAAAAAVAGAWWQWCMCMCRGGGRGRLHCVLREQPAGSPGAAGARQAGQIACTGTPLARSCNPQEQLGSGPGPPLLA